MLTSSLQVSLMTEPARNAADIVETAMFGVDMLRFVNTTPFQQQALQIGATSVRWPGGIIVDPNPGVDGGGATRWIDYAPDGSIAGYVYDLTHDDIIDTTGWPREGLRRAMDFAATNDLAFQMVVPQNRYVIVDPHATLPEDVFRLDLDQAFADLDIFLERLADGHFGEVPEDFTLQFGQEYYLGIVQDMVVAHGLSHDDHMAAIGQLQNAMATHIAEKVAALSAADQNPQGIDPRIAVHMGRIFGGADGNVQGSYTDGAIFAAQFDAAGFAAIDQLLIQRYVPAWAGLDDGFSEPISGRLLSDLVAVWDDAAAALGINEGFDVLAGWAKSSLTRNEVKALYSGSVTSQELTDRSNRDFEEFYQDRLANYNDYGPKHASFLLQQFCEMVGAGVDGATYYGVDLGDAGHITGKTLAGEAVTFLAGTVFQRLAANTQGMALNGSYLDNSRDNTGTDGAAVVNSHIFEDADRIVAYFSVNDIDETAGVQVEVSFGAGPLSGEFASAEGVSLRAVEYGGWRQAFGVADLDALWGAGFQDAEAGLYSVAWRDATGNLPTSSYSLSGNALTLNFTADYEVIEVTLIRVDDGSNPELIGTPQDDTLRGKPGGQVIRGLDGDDLLIGNGGADTIYGDAGNDEVRGGGGFDEIWGGSGDDRLFGDNGNDTIRGEAGADRIWGGAGHDTLFGHAATDRLFGGNGNDILDGGAGADILRGQKGNDTLLGGAGNDTLDGGMGQDTLTGGAGADLFVFVAGDGNDTITDFNTAEGDRIDFSDLALSMPFQSFRDGYMTQTGAGVVINPDTGMSVLLEGVQLSDLTAEAFLFA